MRFEHPIRRMHRKHVCVGDIIEFKVGPHLVRGAIHSIVSPLITGRPGDTVVYVENKLCLALPDFVDVLGFDTMPFERTPLITEEP